MLNVHALKRFHLVGIGGINMSAVAKLLAKSGTSVTGSDLADSDAIKELRNLGIKIAIGPHDERNVPEDCQIVIHTSASREDNPEREAAFHRHLPDVSNFEFLGEWFKDKKIILVTGTHGKSTTTALLAAMCIQANLDPIVIIGSRLPNWPDANLRIGQSDLVIIEGDEYAKHFLSFHPSGLIINNIELDHTDIFADLDDVRHAFERLLRQTKKDATVVVNGESAEAMKAVKSIKLHGFKTITFGRRETVKLQSEAYDAMMENARVADATEVKIKYGAEDWNLKISLMGVHNAMNVTAAAVMAKELGASAEAIQKAVAGFKGLWRRMEFLGERAGAMVFSDYGHHPTAVRETLVGIKQAYPDKRVVLCFQPHHKNRTKHLFEEFAACFDQADILVLCEIYDVAGRDAAEDADVNSQKLLEAIKVKSPKLTAEYAPNPEAAVKQTFALLKPGDLCVFMGAGDIDAYLRSELEVASAIPPVAVGDHLP
ncbi:MAG: UDP-N-acetylmuramate--L-alanine ligase [Patescibacteria group bacterium]|nr:UDP-N-acetylmuramate--L-alanine ligase [Patescibacteria group bacterium]